MRNPQVRPVSGHVFRVDRRSGPVWYAKYRLPDGRQVQKRIGPACCRRGRPAPGFFTKGIAAAWLDVVLRDAEVALCAWRGALHEAAREWLRYVVEDRACKPSTMRDYHKTVERRLTPFLGGMRLVLVLHDSQRHCFAAAAAWLSTDSHFGHQPLLFIGPSSSGARSAVERGRERLTGQGRSGRLTPFSSRSRCAADLLEATVRPARIYHFARAVAVACRPKRKPADYGETDKAGETRFLGLPAQ